LIQSNNVSALKILAGLGKHQARAVYGKELMNNLARCLGDEFGRGLSVANL